MRKGISAYQNTSQKQITGYLCICLFAFLIAWQSPLAKVLQNHGIPAIGTITMLFVIAAVLLNAVCLLSGKLCVYYRDGANHIKELLLVGALNFLGCTGLFLAVRSLDVSMAIVLLYLAPAFVCVFYRITGIREVSATQWIAVGVCFIGCICSLDLFHSLTTSLPVPGILFGLLSAVGLGGYTLGNELLVPPEMSKWAVLLYVLDVAAILSIIIFPEMFKEFTQLDLIDIGIFSYLAGVTKITCMTLLLAGTRIIGAARSQVTQTLEIPFSLAIAFFLLDQTLVPIQFVGIGLVIGSVILMQKE